MASDKSPSCKSKGCSLTPITKWPLGSMKYCKKHFTSLFPPAKNEKEEEYKCSWTLGCGSDVLAIGNIHLSHCAQHLSFSLLFHGVKNAKSAQDLRKLTTKREPNDFCTYIYREAGRGYKTGSRCTLRSNNLYCSYHSHEVAAVDDCIATTIALLDPLWNATVKQTPSTPITSNKEEYCRSLFEKHTGHKFPSVRPDWLKQKRTGQNLELDGYCSKLKLAFEYDGEQHYKFPNVFHKTKQEFNDQQDRDALKEALCAREGVGLLRIRADMRKEEIEGMIVKWLKEKRAVLNQH